MFAVEDPFEDWQPPTSQELRRIAREESEGALEELAAETRAQASITPDWGPYAGKLGVFADEGEVYMGLQPGDEDEQAVFDLEYGTPERAPTGLLRNNVMTYGPRIGRHLAHRVTRRVMGI